VGRAREGTDTLAVLPLLGTPEKRLEVEVSVRKSLGLLKWEGQVQMLIK